MGRSAILQIKILTDATKAAAGLDKASADVGKFQQGMGKAAVPAGIAIAAIGAFAFSAGQAASDVQQSMGAVDSVFEGSAAQVKAWSDTSADAVGLSKNQYGELAAVIGAQLKGAGTPMDELAGKTNDLVTLGGDLAATFGGTTADAVGALSSLLKGERDPIEKYGISIKQADIEAQKAKDGTDKLTGAAEKQADAAAAVKIATDQAAGAVGQFARETDSAAGSQQIATAHWEDAKAALGEALLPVMSTLADKLADVAKWVEENSTLVGIIVGVIAAFAAVILVVNAAMSLYAAATAIAAVAQMALFWPILLIIAGIIALIAVIVLVVKNWDTIKAAALKVWAAIKAATAAVVAWFRAAWAAVFAWIRGALAAVGAWFASVWAAIRAAVAAVVASVRAVWAAVFAWIKGAVAAVRASFSNAFNAVKSAVGRVADGVKSVWRSVFDALRRAVDTVVGVIRRPFDTVKSAIDNVIGAIRNLIDWFGRIKVPKISLPKIPGFNSAPAVAAAPGVAATAGRLAAPRATSGSSSAGLTIVIQGAVDPEATARQIRRILGAHGRRMGLTGAGLSGGVV